MSCRICNKRHHSLLHQQTKQDTSGTPENQAQPTVSAYTNVEESEEINTMMTYHLSKRQGTAMLATALVIAEGETGNTTMLRALIDQGSEASFISEKASQLLKLPRKAARGSVIGMGSSKSSVKQKVQFKVLSRYDSQFSLNIEAFVINKQLTTKIPHRTMTIRNWQHIKGLKLADPKFFKSEDIDLLIGVKEYSQILSDGFIKGPSGTPCAQNSHLGWILFGEVDQNQHEESFVVMYNGIDVDDMLKRFWEIDSDSTRIFTKNEQKCEDIYNSTYRRRDDGKYIVKLPFKTDYPQSVNGNTRDISLKRFLQLERRFKTQPKLKEEYVKVIEDYIQMKHLEEIPKDEINNKGVYLPHHAVIREDKETTKTRVVFDASCKGSNGISLNDELLPGPVLQDDLRSIILRWRMHAIGFVSDITKMYRMILLTKEDIDYQRILWRQNPNEDIKDYRLLTVTFGTASAPYLAIKTLMQLAQDEGDNYPIAANMIRQNFYVDDLMSGSETVEKAIETKNQLQQIMNKGGFELKKWSSNSFDFMNSMNPTERSSNVHIDVNIDGSVKALGVLWNLQTDCFEYSINFLPINSNITKRIILSDLQKIFDPLGWIAPSIILAKILVQKLWSEGVGWDDKINSILEQEWLKIRMDFEMVKDIHIDRWLKTSESKIKTIEVHGFCDASSKAYAAVAYIRVIGIDGNIYTNLIAARTKVAPLKTISLPRLELCGALLLSKLLKKISQALNIPLTQIHAWTDSSIVISWLCGDPNRWKLFVANRVVEINDNLNNKKWNHVRTEDNPADIASRGMLLVDLKNANMWWHGPKCLSEKEINYTQLENITTNLEKKKEKIISNLHIENQEHIDLYTRFEEFDNLEQLLKTIIICKRFLNYKRNTDINLNFTTEEYESSLMTCIFIVQNKQFQKEIEDIKTKKYVKNISKLKTLNPYLDGHNILRVGGRLRYADIREDTKHPIILDDKNPLTALIIKDAHAKTLHGGIQLMLNYIRSKYWILKAKNLIKAYIRKCLICAKERARASTQKMGDLPAVRVKPARAFLNSGVDFAGPYSVLKSKGRGERTYKGYICIFICMATKAIHLEFVGDLTSEAFIGAFKRFVARRGRCTHLWSDQGRNFIAANRELTEAWNEAQLEFTGSILESLSSDGTQWHFIPPYSPNFGGLWEAGVKSIKYHLKRILTTHVTYEEMTTILCQIEACLNSRPLCPIDDSDCDSLNYLTPGHFLIGEAPINIPSPDLTNININHLTRWQFTQKLIQDFWHRWQQEYLSRLQQRPKWFNKANELEIGQIVLIKTDNLPPGKWALGRIVDKHPGGDGLTRVYSVKSGNNITKRTVTKLCLLPIDTDC